MKWERFSELKEKEVINICDGKRLGSICDLEIDSMTGKIEVYKKDGDSVVSVDKYLFIGFYSTDYKSYLINREKNLFGLYVYCATFDKSTIEYGNAYLLFSFDGEKLCVAEWITMESTNYSMIRATIVDGYLYITTTTRLVVEKL